MRWNSALVAVRRSTFPRFSCSRRFNEGGPPKFAVVRRDLWVLARYGHNGCENARMLMLKTAVKMGTPLGAMPARRHQFDRNADGVTGTFLRLFAVHNVIGE